MDKLLMLLDQNARLSNEQLAVMLDKTPEEIAAAIEQYEKDGVIRGYKAIIDWDKIDREYVTAYIEVKVTPKRDQGFDEIAEKIMEFPEVESVTLMSGGYDLSAVISGKSFKDIALFVAKKLSVMDSVLSTATHFALRRYKDGGISFVDKEVDERGINIL